MAAYRKRGNAWRVEVAKNGIRTSATFDTKAEAKAWAAKTETEILAGKRGDVPNKTFGELLSRYADEVSSTKRGERWERLRIGLVQRDEIALVKLSDLSSRDVAAWRDRRLRSVSAASVRREWTLLSHACGIAVKEWRWLKENPMKEVRRPPPPRARDRRIGENEIERLLFALGYDYGTPPGTATARVGSAMLFAIETGMRAGEISGLAWHDLFLSDRYLRITGEVAGAGKTAAAKRDVPLSPEALRIIGQMERIEGQPVFRLNTQQIDALFRKAKARAMIEDLHFHDLRAEAITRLAKKLDILTLARVVGHRDLRMLQIYYRESAADIAGRL